MGMDKNGRLFRDTRLGYDLSESLQQKTNSEEVSLVQKHEFNEGGSYRK